MWLFFLGSGIMGSIFVLLLVGFVLFVFVFYITLEVSKITAF